MAPDDNADRGPVLFAYDGSEHARNAIEEAGQELRTGRPAIVLSVVQPLESIPFWGVPMATVPTEVREEAEKEAEKTAAEGVGLAKAAGFEAEPATVEGSPVWKPIVEVADQRGVSMVVLGSHGRTGVGYMAMGSVATAVAHHAKVPVMICRLAAG